MFFLREIRSHPEFRQGLRATASVATGTAAWGLMTGVAMVKSGMSIVEAVAMTLLVYSGSAQLTAVPLIVAGAPPWVVWAAASCVNLRFVVFSLHLRPYLMHLPRWRRMLNGFFTADTSYAIFTQRFDEVAKDGEGRLAQEAFLAGNYCLLWISWTFSSYAGIAFANIIPPGWGLAYAGVLCLLGVLCSMANTPLRALAALAAGATAIAAHAAPLKLNIVLAIGVAVLLCLWLEARIPPAREEQA